jgi:hypothetical protein
MISNKIRLIWLSVIQRWHRIKEEVDNFKNGSWYAQIYVTVKLSSNNLANQKP